MRSGKDKHTIAIVNNERSLVQFLVRGLENAGYVVRPYSNTADALELIEKPADVALLDKTNHPFDGIELYRRLRERSQMPVIFLSAWADEIPDDLRRKGLPAAEGYIQLPFLSGKLFAVVEAVLARRA